MSTLLESVRESLKRAARYNPDDAVQPVAILWPDPDEQWRPVVDRLRPLMPELLTLGDYHPDARTGPVIWLRCAIEDALPEQVPLGDEVPVVYLPGVKRQDLRAGQECPEALKPLIELQYRGVCWMQRNGRDWTVEAFLVAKEGGLGLDVARDATTRRALHAALPELVDTPIQRLEGKHLEADDFNHLLSDDPVKDMLHWLGDPAASKESWTTNSSKWEVFRSICRSRFGLDPEDDGELVGAEHLAKREGDWSAVWERFAEAPTLYPGIPRLLRRVSPEGLVFDPSPWPQKNDEWEKALRTKLLEVGDKDSAAAREAIRALEKQHGERRDWVWAKLGWTPLANSLAHLALLAERTANGLTGVTLEEFSNKYSQEAYQTDLAVSDALASVKSAADVEAVTAAIRSVYLPWLEEAANAFQKVLQEENLKDGQDPIAADTDNVVLFVDGLRFDVAHRLVNRMRERGWNPTLGRRWAGIPTVTATGKYLVSPVAGKLEGGQSKEEFLPSVSETTNKLTTDRFRKLLSSADYRYLAQEEHGEGTGRGWTEYGNLDQLGHHLERELADQIDSQLDLIMERVNTLFEAGWKGVRIVTDHGWLLMPGGLPKVDLPKYLTESRWSRCAAVKGASKVDVPVFPWTWNPDERIAMAPGISCFKKGNEYAHGGISVQECLIPDIWVYPARTAEPSSISIDDVKWLGLRCQVTVSPAQPAYSVDLRLNINNEASSQVEPKQPNEDGIARLLVADDALEGTSAIVVVLNESGHVVSKQPTIVGGDESA